MFSATRSHARECQHGNIISKPCMMSACQTCCAYTGSMNVCAHKYTHGNLRFGAVCVCVCVFNFVFLSACVYIQYLRERVLPVGGKASAPQRNTEQ